MTEIQFGAARIQSIEEARQPTDIQLLTTDTALVSANAGWLAPTFLDLASNRFDLVFQTYLIRLEDAVVVVDPCVGNGKTRKMLEYFDHLDTNFLERFEATGVDVEAVTTVFCTHLHCDHCGWNTRLRAGRWVPTFPNARYIFVRREFDRWDPRQAGHQPVGYNEGVFEDSVLPVLEAGLADLVADHHRLGAGLSIEPAYGHTSGHSMLRLTSGVRDAYFIGDAFHHPLQILRPELDLGGCDNLADATATRRRLRARFAGTETLVIPAHFPVPGRFTLSDGIHGFARLNEG
jgi:glyoxylase-like metal-dependent hydrolase (beta-lactamase superfamily II)